MPNGIRDKFPYKPLPGLAALLFGVALVLMIGPTLLLTIWPQLPWHFTAGENAAAVASLVVVALVLQAPALILDGSPQVDGEPSTMRIVSLAIVLTFCALMIKVGWDKDWIPAPDNGWLWIVTAAIGGKAVQAWTEMTGQKTSGGGTVPAPPPAPNPPAAPGQGG